VRGFASFGGSHQSFPPTRKLNIFSRKSPDKPNWDKRYVLQNPEGGTAADPHRIEDLYATPKLSNAHSSSPVAGASSPSVTALSRRQGIGPSAVSKFSEEASDSTLPRSDARLLQPKSNNSIHSTIQLGHAPPVVQGIPLVSVNDLADRFRSLFPFSLFNAVQSRCFKIAFNTDENLVLSAPTGSGKTVIMELAICRLVHSVRSGDFKIVYQAPTKALCSERCSDWQSKFGPLDLSCAELTGETDAGQMRSVQAASIIVTTPEKWDSITRRWKDHVKLMRLVKLFLIDEVHILKESRGATLEAVVSRMKSTGNGVRFVALSATIPNPHDIAKWLGKDSLHPHVPAGQEAFGEEFRPVQLQKVVYGYPVKSNDFVFDSVLESKSVSTLIVR
jgi:ATP-dependent DNA helicase HFM1/MER3